MKYECQVCVCNMKNHIKNAVILDRDNHSLDNLLGGQTIKGLENPINNGLHCNPYNLTDSSKGQVCSAGLDCPGAELLDLQPLSLGSPWGKPEHTLKRVRTIKRFTHLPAHQHSRAWRQRRRLWLRHARSHPALHLPATVRDQPHLEELLHKYRRGRLVLLRLDLHQREYRPRLANAKRLLRRGRRPTARVQLH